MVKLITYKESDIQQIMDMLNALILQGLNNIQIVSGIAQILATKQINSDIEGEGS